MIRDKVITVKECVCDRCGHTWISLGDKQTDCCPNRKCRTREWDGLKLRPHVNEIKFPAPRKGGRPKTIAFVEGDE